MNYTILHGYVEYTVGESTFAVHRFDISNTDDLTNAIIGNGAQELIQRFNKQPISAYITLMLLDENNVRVKSLNKVGINTILYTDFDPFAFGQSNTVH